MDSDGSREELLETLTHAEEVSIPTNSQAHTTHTCATHLPCSALFAHQSDVPWFYHYRGLLCSIISWSPTLETILWGM